MSHYIKFFSIYIFILLLFGCATAPTMNLKYQLSTNTDPFKPINTNNTYDGI